MEGTWGATQRAAKPRTDMISVADLKCIELFDTLCPAALESLSREINELALETGDYIVHQHDEARAIYILLSGSVEFRIATEGTDDLFVGTTAEPGALIGWSIVREPHRYTASVRCTEPSRVLRLPRSAMARILKDNPRAGRRILAAIAAALVDRLEDARSLAARPPKAGPRQEA